MPQKSPFFRSTKLSDDRVAVKPSRCRKVIVSPFYRSTKLSGDRVAVKPSRCCKVIVSPFYRSTKLSGDHVAVKPCLIITVSLFRHVIRQESPCATIHLADFTSVPLSYHAADTTRHLVTITEWHYTHITLCHHSWGPQTYPHATTHLTHLATIWECQYNPNTTCHHYTVSAHRLQPFLCSTTMSWSNP